MLSAALGRPELFTLLAMFCAGLAASAINAVAGGGSLITFPVLVALGVSELSANATNSAALWIGGLGSAVGFWPQLKRTRHHLRLLLLPTALGSAAGVALLAEHPEFPPDHLEFEILETSALEDIAKVTEVMYGCRELGVRFALDDFGTGYSSLTYLKRLPADVLKIDRSFVSSLHEAPENLAIVEGVVGLARAFSRGVIAEGVESAAQGEVLLALGCEIAQGYALARPMPADEIPRWIALRTGAIFLREAA
jgi:hypothetical protein